MAPTTVRFLLCTLLLPASLGVAVCCRAQDEAATAAPPAAAPAPPPKIPPSLVPKPSAPVLRPFTLEDRWYDAARRGDIAMMKLCLEKGVDPKGKDPTGRSALHFAVRDARSVEAARFLHELGLPVDEPDGAGRTPLADAAGNGDVAMVSWLIEQGASVSRRDAQGQTPLFNAVLAGSTDTVRRLLAAGASANAADNFGDTPLMGACEKGNDEMARLLVEKGADAASRDQEGRTAAMRAPQTATYCRSLPGAKPPPGP